MTELQVEIEELERKLKILREAQALLDDSDKSHASLKPAHIETDDVKKVILNMEGEFSAKDIPAAIKRKFPPKPYYNKSAIPSALHQLVKLEKQIEYLTLRSGRKGATYQVKRKH